MLFERRSIVSGIVRTLDINVSEAQIQAWENGHPIDLAMPNISDSEREFILTGITDEEWDETFAESEDYNEGDEYFSD